GLSIELRSIIRGKPLTPSGPARDTELFHRLFPLFARRTKLRYLAIAGNQHVTISDYLPSHCP
ncbi:hypothetical protein ACTFJG_13640, partial [Klebsiella electrica]|uniref:hypothetical protein n=1 Tax=Klebsiella electrica TaxID=1259973 RepID=UPI003F75D0FB